MCGFYAIAATALAVHRFRIIRAIIVLWQNLIAAPGLLSL
jgi:hypothetical protein